MLHCDAVVAHVETRIGLPEATLGILPGWGGCTRMLDACLALETADPAAAAARAFTILQAGPSPRMLGRRRASGISTARRRL
jgi:3-hydroxyacyl-CoA dehydrogenase